MAWSIVQSKPYTGRMCPGFRKRILGVNRAGTQPNRMSNKCKRWRASRPQECQPTQPHASHMGTWGMRLHDWEVLHSQQPFSATNGVTAAIPALSAAATSPITPYMRLPATSLQLRHPLCPPLYTHKQTHTNNASCSRHILRLRPST